MEIIQIRYYFEIQTLEILNEQVKHAIKLKRVGLLRDE